MNMNIINMNKYEKDMKNKNKYSEKIRTADNYNVALKPLAFRNENYA